MWQKASNGKIVIFSEEMAAPSYLILPAGTLGSQGTRVASLLMHSQSDP